MDSLQQTTINQYFEGLDRDTNKHEYKSTKYFNLENGKIVSQDGLSSVTISNVKGTIPILDSNGNHITSITGYTLVGWCNLGADIILFYSSDTTDKGQIYKLVQNTELTFSITLIYEDDNLNFGNVLQAIGRYENEYIQKVYWIDDFNNMIRSLNIVSNSYPITLDVEKLNIVQTTDFSTPQFSSFTSGELQSGVIQYAYRYYNLNGIETMFSPCSAIIPLTAERETIGVSLYKGTAPSINTQKGVIGTISNLDSSFDRVEIVSIWYGSLNGTPIINVVSRQPFSSTVTFTDTGTYIASLTLDEFTLLSNPLYAKSIAIKDQRMFLGNIQEDVFWSQAIQNWDARAYRFADSSNDVYLSHNGTLTLYSDIADVPDDNDAINLTNIISNDGNMSDEYRQFYQQGSSVLGGTGINISYTFNASDYLIDDDSTNACHKATIDANNINEQLGLKRSWQRDEIYRFGIVFYDKYGRSSFVKWIGDIRIPHWDGNNKYVNYTNSLLYGRHIYPIFTVSNLPTDVISWQIVYVNRGVYDKTVVATGLGLGLEDSYDVDGNFACTIWVNNPNTTTANSITDRRNGDLNWAKYYNILEFDSPEIVYGTQEVSGDYIDLIGYFTLGTRTVALRDILDPVFRQTKYREFIGNPNIDYSYRRRNIQDLQFLHPGQNTNVNGHPFTNVGDNDGTHNSFPPLVDYEETCSHCTKWIVGIDNEYGVTNPYFNLVTNIGVFSVRKNVIGYGGNTFNDRYNNSYISASDRINVNTNIAICYYGDTYINMIEELRCIWQDTLHPSQEWMYYPCESSVNPVFDYGYSQSKSLSISAPTPKGLLLDTYWFTDYVWQTEDRLYIYNKTYSQQYNIHTFFPVPLDIQLTTKYPYQVRYSDAKYDGEEIDSWLKFRPLNSNNVVGNYGEVTSIVEQTNQLYCFQEHGVSAISSNRQELSSASSGVPVVLGKGGVLDRFDYLSTEIGNQFGDYIVTTASNIYWLDRSLQKMYRIGTSGMETLSDTKSVGSIFKNVVDLYTTFDGIYDIKNNRCYFTVHNTYPNYLATVTYISTGIYRLSLDLTSIITRGTSNNTLLQLGNTYEFSYNGIVGTFRVNSIDYVNWTITVEDLDNVINDVTPNYTIDLSEYIDYKNQYTLSYNEFVDGYESFHSFIPDWYLTNNNSLMTYKDTEKEIFLHNTGIYGNYYNASDIYPMRLDIIVNNNGKAIREFNNINWRSECTVGNQDLKDETIKYILAENNYQQTDKIKLYQMLDDDYIFFSESINLPSTSWSASGTYTENSVVRYTDDKLYIGIGTPINASDTPSISSKWDEYKLCNLRRVKRQWNTGIPRDEDNYLNVPTYSVTLYQVGDAVQYKYKRYICKVKVQTYSVSQWFNTDECVLYSGAIYKSKTSQKGVTPTGASWANITSSFIPSGTDDDTIYWEYSPLYNRMLDTYVRVNLWYINKDNHKFVLHDMQTTCEIQP